MFRATMLSIVISALFVMLAYFLKSRYKAKQQPTGFVRTFSKAGAPDQMEQTEMDDFENSKMVSEGSQFGVQYFNKFMHD